MANFSRKHYLFVSDWLLTNIKSRSDRAEIVTELSKMFKHDNPDRFDEIRFYENADVTDFLIEKAME